LFIKLIAFSLNKKLIRLNHLRDDIRDGKIARINSKDKKTFKIHLQKTFDKQFQNEENSQLKKLLQILALFPAIEIDLKILEKILGDDRIEGELQLLVNSGWLINKADSYKLHQIIKNFMLEEYVVAYEDITYILKNIGTYIEPDDKTVIASQLNEYIPIIDSLLFLFEKQQDDFIAGILDSNTYLYYSLGEYGNALEMQKKSCEIREKLFGYDSEFTAKNYNVLGVVYDEKGEYKKALPLYEKALKIREEVLGENHPDTAGSYNNLAGLYKSKGEYDKSLPLYEKALKIREKVLGENHPGTAVSYNNLAALYASKGEYDKALPLYEKALTIKEEVLGENHPDTATSYNNLALLYESKGEYDKALPLYEKDLKISEEVLGENHPDTALSYNNLAGFYKDMKLCTKAKELFEKCIEVVEGLEYSKLSLIGLRRALKDTNASLKKEKKAKFKDKGRYCKEEL